MRFTCDFDIRASSLPDEISSDCLRSATHRINADGVVVIKAQTIAASKKIETTALAGENRALMRPLQLYRLKRRPTRPTRRLRKNALKRKCARGQIQALRDELTTRLNAGQLTKYSTVTK